MHVRTDRGPGRERRRRGRRPADTARPWLSRRSDEGTATAVTSGRPRVRTCRGPGLKTASRRPGPLKVLRHDRTGASSLLSRFGVLMVALALAGLAATAAVPGLNVTGMEDAGSVYVLADQAPLPTAGATATVRDGPGSWPTNIAAALLDTSPCAISSSPPRPWTVATLGLAVAGQRWLDRGGRRASGPRQGRPRSAPTASRIEDAFSSYRLRLRSRNRCCS